MKKKILFTISLIMIISLLSIYAIIFFYPETYISHPMYIQINDKEENYIYSTLNNRVGIYTYVNDVSDEFLKTLIAIEDQHFYQHNGLDYLRIIKSGYDNLITSSINEGASTITQQLARLLYLSNEKTFSRKIKEAIIAKKIESKYTKKEILEFYLNSLYFAHNIYGIGNASQYYFNKDPSELNYSESCMLLGIINGPNIYSPFIDYLASIKKQKQIAYQLYKLSIIDAKEYYNILLFPPTLNYNYPKNNDYFYYHQAIIKQLNNQYIINKNNLTTGLHIDSFLDYKLQKRINSIIKKYDFEDQIAVVVMKPYSGEVISLIGGKNPEISEYNRALESQRQIGSTIKPLIYYLSLLYGLSPLTEFTSEPTTFNLDNNIVYSPKNSNDIYAYRKINMIEALAMSDNIYAVKTALAIGTKNIVSLLKQFDVKTKNNNITMSLGNIDLTPLQLAAIYNTFASEGVYYKPSFIKRVTRKDNILLYQYNNYGKRILEKEECVILNYLLRSPFDNALTSYSSPTMKNYKVDDTFCVKTGTTSSSSWTVGFNPNYTILVYIGDDNNENLKDGTISKKIWRDIAISLSVESKNKNFYSYPINLVPFKIYNGVFDCFSKTYIRKKLSSN